MLEKLREADRGMDMGTALVLLYVAQYPGITVSELQRLADLDKSAASRHVLILTEKGDVARGRKGMGLVEYYPDPQDARVKHVKLTAKGQALASGLLKITTMN
jgi:DNA-binding MarR family transcriptional regulator